MLIPTSPALHAETSFHKMEKRLRKLEKKTGSAMWATAEGTCTVGKWVGCTALGLGVLFAIGTYEDLLENGPPEHSTAPNPPSTTTSSQASAHPVLGNNAAHK
ncbi:MAG TPA: hypothetical protein VK395_35785 [Gemmataceae bacterium]|nr:hypothetical protein [Gemmataceae bacterium]